MQIEDILKTLAKTILWRMFVPQWEEGAGWWRLANRHNSWTSL